MRRIGIDIDGVIYPWADAANDAVMREFKIKDPGPHVHWYHLRDTLTPEQWTWVWSHDGKRKIFGQNRFYEDGIREVIEEILHNKDWSVHFVTHRDPGSLGAITANYLMWLFPSKYQGLHVTGNDVNKHELLGWDAFIDDKPETAEMLTPVCPLVFMPNRPWNQAAKLPGVIRYDNPQVILSNL